MADQRNEYKRILITGASSYVGSYLCRKFSDAVKLQNTDVKVYGFYNTHSINFKGIIPVRCDITKEDSFSSLFKEITPDVVYHLASLTPMRSLGRDSGTVFRINKEVTGHIAELCAGINSLMIYTSTDLVYKEGTDLREGTSDTGPVTPYAASKLEGEKEIIRHGCRTIILRMSLVYGFSISSYTSFFDTAYDSLSRGVPIKAFTDQRRNALYAEDAAENLFRIASLYNRSEILNFCGDELLSRYDMCISMAEEFGFDKGLIHQASCDDFTEYPMVKLLGLNHDRMMSLGLKTKAYAENLKRAAKILRTGN